MGETIQEISEQEMAEEPNILRMARYLIDIGLFEDDITGNWPRVREYVESLRWQVDGQSEPKEPQPASQEAIQKLENMVIQTEGKECSICLMDFKKDETVKSMPCHHLFHEICLITWLNQNNTCPFCRHRLPVAAAQ